MCVRRFEVRVGRADRRAAEMTGVGVEVWWVARESAGGGYRALTPSSVHFSYYLNNRQPITEAAIETCSPLRPAAVGVSESSEMVRHNGRSTNGKETRRRHATGY